MSHANVHIGKLQVYNELDVEDKLTCESDAEVLGTLYANGIKMSDTTTVTEEDIAKIRKGDNWVIDDASLAPATKMIKLNPETDGSGNIIGLEEKVDMSNQTDYIQANGVIAQDQVFSHTGFDTSDATTSTSIVPGAITTDTLAVTNLVARGYDPNVTVGGVPNQINVMVDKLKLRVLLQWTVVVL